MKKKFPKILKIRLYNKEENIAKDKGKIEKNSDIPFASVPDSSLF